MVGHIYAEILYTCISGVDPETVKFPKCTCPLSIFKCSSMVTIK